MQFLWRYDSIPYLPIHFLFCFKFKPFSLHYSFNLFSRQNSFRFPFAPIWPLNSVGFCIGRYSTQPRKLLNTAWQAQDTPTHAQWRFTHRAWRPLASHGFWCLQWHAYSSWLYCSYVLLRFFFLFLGELYLASRNRVHLLKKAIVDHWARCWKFSKSSGVSPVAIVLYARFSNKLLYGKLLIVVVCKGMIGVSICYIIT